MIYDSAKTGPITDEEIREALDEGQADEEALADSNCPRAILPEVKQRIAAIFAEIRNRCNLS